MKKIFTLFCFALVGISLNAQSEIDSLVDMGIELHDNGQFEWAIDVYKKALALEPNSPLVNYEIALTYMSTKEYDKAIKHSNAVIENNTDNLLQAYMLKASCMDYLGKPKEAVKMYQKAIRKYGDHYLLSYNLGYTYYNMSDEENAEKWLTDAIEQNPSHASSHLMLAYLMKDNNQKIKSLLSLHYFLFLEPNSKRSFDAFDLLIKQFSGNVEKEKVNPNQINIMLNGTSLENEFGGVELMISLLEASKTIEENKNKTKEEMFIEHTSSFFKMLGELNRKKKKGLYWDYYIPFFNEVANSEHIDAYCYYISQSSNGNAEVWLSNNTDKIDKFSKWLQRE
jgi:Tfp pilus assembly protein PilF